MDHASIGANPEIRKVDVEDLTLSEVLRLVRSGLVLLMLIPLGAGLTTLGLTYLIPPSFTAVTTFMPPQQAQSSAVSALASLGALGGLAAASGGIGMPADRYVALMQSMTVSEQIIQRFKLQDVYGTRLLTDSRAVLARLVKISVGKKDGLIRVEVEDGEPRRAAAMANQYVDELRRLTSALAVTEAQQRRVFFEAQLRKARDQLTQAQLALQSSGFNQGALRTEPKAAAETYVRLKDQLAAAEVKLSTLRGNLAESTPEVQQQLATLVALRIQLSRIEVPADSAGNADYVGRYREFKYQETLFEMLARQYEMARADESREGALIQVVDPAKVPERPSGPRRLQLAALVAALSLGLCALVIVIRGRMKSRPA